MASAKKINFNYFKSSQVHTSEQLSSKDILHIWQPESLQTRIVPCMSVVLTLKTSIFN